eukprot:1143489-Pelagomonas_calceolata.AAC.2
MACAQSTSINSNAPSLKASRRDKFSLTYMFTVGLSLQADGLAAQYSRAFKGELAQDKKGKGYLTAPDYNDGRDTGFLVQQNMGKGWQRGHFASQKLRRQ